jgi:Fe-S-cluster-containing hydrogenase component 2
MKAITVNENSITVSNECIGCGICASKCPHEAIEMLQVKPFKEKIQDYFWGVRPEIGGK